MSYQNNVWPVVNFEDFKCDIYIGRPSRWGSPFMVGINGSRKNVMELYEGYLFSTPKLIESAVTELFGKVLGCWCYPLICHGDILVRVANGWQLAKPLEIDYE